MLTPEFVILFHLKTNNYTINSLRSVGIHPQKAKNAIKNLVDIGMIHSLGDGVYGVHEDVFDRNIDLIEENINLKRKFNQLKILVNHKINEDINSYKNIDSLVI